MRSNEKVELNLYYSAFCFALTAISKRISIYLAEFLIKTKNKSLSNRRRNILQVFHSEVELLQGVGAAFEYSYSKGYDDDPYITNINLNITYRILNF